VASSTESFGGDGAHRSRLLVEMTIDSFRRRPGARLGLMTLGFRENLKDFCEAAKRWRKLRDGVVRSWPDLLGVPALELPSSRWCLPRVNGGRCGGVTWNDCVCCKLSAEISAHALMI